MSHGPVARPCDIACQHQPNHTMGCTSQQFLARQQLHAIPHTQPPLFFLRTSQQAFALEICYTTAVYRRGFMKTARSGDSPSRKKRCDTCEKCSTYAVKCRDKMMTHSKPYPVAHFPCGCLTAAAAAATQRFHCGCPTVCTGSNSKRRNHTCPNTVFLQAQTPHRPFHVCIASQH